MKTDQLKELQDRRDAAPDKESKHKAQAKIDYYFLSAKMPKHQRPGRERDDHKRKTKKDRKFIYGI